MGCARAGCLRHYQIRKHAASATTAASASAFAGSLPSASTHVHVSIQWPRLPEQEWQPYRVEAQQLQLVDDPRKVSLVRDATSPQPVHCGLPVVEAKPVVGVELHGVVGGGGAELVG